MLEPGSEAELAEDVAGAEGPLRIRGGGTRDVGRPVAGEVLSVAGLSGVRLYEPGALTIVAGAGTPLAEIEAALAAEGQRLPFEPMDHRALLGTEGVPTIGGAVAANASGPRRIQAGACRDSLIGVRFVDGAGTVVKNGGRVMKNVTGYDLVKLMAGSWGTLGVLSEVAFKVLPKPPAAATLVYSACGWTASSALFAKAMGTPFEVNGAARVPEGVLGKYGAVVLRIEGFEDSVAYRAEALAKSLSGISGKPDKVIRDPAENEALWRSVRDVECMAGFDGDVWKVSMKPTDVTWLAEHFSHEEVLLDWAGGMAWLGVAPGTDLRELMSGIGGHATLVRASEATRAALPVFQPEPAPLAAIAEGLRRKFDPHGILNPGLMA